MKRKGLSFTLTLVVIGVILLMTALTLITLGGASLENIFGWLGGQQDDTELNQQIRDACGEAATAINDRYCEQYVDPSCTGQQANPGGDADRTATSRGCDYAANSGEYDVTAGTQASWNSGVLEVTVGGGTYSCMEQGQFSSNTICSAP